MTREENQAFEEEKPTRTKKRNAEKSSEVLPALKELMAILLSTIDLALAEVNLAWRSIPSMFAWFFFFSGFVLLGWMGLSIMVSYAVFILAESNLLALFSFFFLQIAAAVFSFVTAKRLLSRIYLPNTVIQLNNIKGILYELSKIRAKQSAKVET